jgi:hypothetical protein
LKGGEQGGVCWTYNKAKDAFEPGDEFSKIVVVNEHWPWEFAPRQLVTLAPFAVNKYNAETGFFKLPEAKQARSPF